MQEITKKNIFEQNEELEEIKKNILKMEEKELLMFIDKKFGVKTESILVFEIEKRIKLLNNLEENVRNVGIARMKRAQDTNNTVTYIPFFIGFMLAMLSAYYQTFGAVKEAAGFAGLIITSTLLFYFVRLLNSNRQRKGIAIYFQSLLETVRK